MLHLCATQDTLASASSRQKQAEKMDQQSLEQLVAHVKGLERSLAVVDSSPKLEKLCRLEAESRAQRQEKHQMELEALRTAKALNELLWFDAAGMIQNDGAFAVAAVQHHETMHFILHQPAPGS